MVVSKLIFIMTLYEQYIGPLNLSDSFAFVSLLNVIEPFVTSIL